MCIRDSVIAESYLCGTPVITTKGAPWSMIEKYNCGWWIDRTVDELTYAIIDFVHTPIEKRRLMGLRGRQLVKERFASDIVAVSYTHLDVYKRQISYCSFCIRDNYGVIHCIQCKKC